ERERKIIQSLLAQQADGLVIQATGANTPYLSEIAHTLPVVLVDREYPVPHAHRVLTNNEEASAALTSGLFTRGYRRVLFVSEPVQEVSTRRGRYAGYLAACQQNGQDPWVTWVERDRPESLAAVVEEVRAAAARWLPFAVYTANGLVFSELYPGLRNLGLAVPAQLGLATFDRPDWAPLLTPPLTTIEQPVNEMGTHAAELLIRALSRQRIPARQTRRVFPSTLRWAASTGDL
ncbi:MAG: substrate-binding domain-containing protein, partial [Alicyclobacillus sp.]|nr:substrate-binding domain-containing protein [Alicyclobacillus sp.]